MPTGPDERDGLPMMDPGAINGGSTVSRSRAVAAVELDGEAVLYHEELRTVCVLNPTATIVWNCLDGSSDLETLCGDIADAFAVELDTIRREVVEIVRELGRQGLLEGVESDPDIVAAHTVSGPDACDHDHD